MRFFQNKNKYIVSVLLVLTLLLQGVFADGIIDSTNVFDTTATSGDIIDPSAWNALLEIINHENLLPTNIRAGISIGGVTGNYQGSVDATGVNTSDATAASSDILAGKNAYGSAGTKLVGTIPVITSNVTGLNGVTSISLPSGYYQGVNVVSQDTNLLAANIKNGVSVFGVTGTLDAIAAASLWAQGGSHLFYDTGNVGIGFTSPDPTEKLEVLGNVKATSFIGSGAALTGIITTESDPTIGILTTGKWCSSDGSEITCTQDAPGGSASFGTLTTGKWCSYDGSDIVCTVDAPVASESDTLDTVIGRGAITTAAITIGGLTVDTDTLYVDSINNRVGIGNTSPAYELDVTGTVKGNILCMGTDCRTQWPAGVTAEVDTFAIVVGRGSVTTASITTGGLIVDTDTFVVDSANNRVGIGIASPTSALDIVGDVNFTGSLQSGTVPVARISGLGSLATASAVTDAQVPNDITVDTASALSSMAISQFTNDLAYLTAVTSSDITDGQIVNADISASAGISNSKISGLGSLATASAVTDSQVPNDITIDTATALSSMNISQFTNDSSYLTSFTEADTLDTVVGRGATTTAAITTGKITTSRATESTATQLELRNEGGISTGNYDGLSFTQGATGAIDLGAIKLHYLSSGQTEMGFETRSGEHLRIADDGKVGIGITAPEQQLHIKNDGGPAIPLLVQRTATNANAVIEVRDDNDSIFFGKNSSDGFAVNTAADLSSSALFTIESGGYVGIGTTSPTSLLHSKGPGFPVIQAERTSTATNSVNIGLETRHTTTGDMVDGFGSGMIFSVQDSSGAVGNFMGYISGVRSGSDTTGDLVFTNSNAGSFQDNMIIKAGGDVGIGTTSPSYALDVNGNIRSYVQGVRTNLAFKIDNGTPASWTQNNVVGHYWTGSQDALSLQVPQSATTNGTSLDMMSDGTMIFNGASNEKMRLLADGKIGIGTAVPYAQLEVAANANVNQPALAAGASATVGSFGFATPYGGSSDDYPSNVISTNFSSGRSVYGHGVRGSRSGEAVSASSGFVSTYDNFSGNRAALTMDIAGNFAIWNSGSALNTAVGSEVTMLNRFNIAGNGSVGIGTASPTGIVHIKSNDLGSVFQTSSAVNKRVQTFFQDSSATQTGRIGVDISGSNDDDLQFIAGSGSAPQLHIEADGNVGVGTTSPNSTLHVDGPLTLTGATADGANSQGTMNFGTANGYKINGGADYLGIDFYTNSAERMTIRDSGFVGIGTTTPAGIFDVNQSTTSNMITRFWNKDSSGTGKSIVRIANSGNNAKGAILEFSDNTSYNASVTVDRTNGMVFHVGNVASEFTIPERMRIDQSGNVGIGTTSPTTTLEVQKDTTDTTLTSGNSANDTLSLLNETDTTGNYTSIGFVGNAAEVTARIASVADASNGRGNLSFSTGDSSTGVPLERMRIDSSGNVGIGTSTPAYALDVAGAARVQGTLHLGSQGYINNWTSLGSTQGANPYPKRWYKVYELTGTGTGEEVIQMDVAGDPNASGGNTVVNLQISRHESEAAGKLHVAVTPVSGFAGNAMISIDGGDVWVGSNVIWGSISGRILKSRYNPGRNLFSGTYLDATPPGTRIDATSGIVMYDSDASVAYYHDSKAGNGYFSGNVGVGTTVPASTLHVDGPLTLTGATADGANSQGTMNFGTTNGYNINGGSDYLGLDFYTNGAERMTIRDSGRVGIGTTAPTNLFNVVGDSNHDAVARFKTTGTGTGDYAEISVENDDGNQLVMGSIGSNYANADWAGASYIYSTGTGRDLYLKSADVLGIYSGGTTAAHRRMTIDATGNVGIGTTTPAEELHVNGDVRLGSNPQLKWASNELTMGTADDAIGVLTLAGSASYAPRMEIKNAGNSATRVYLNGGGNSYISGGLVGIGTTTPAEQLSVNGATELRSDGGVGNNGRSRITGVYDAGGSNYGGALTLETRSNANVWAEHMRITKTGNVGIGDTTPERTLDVQGLVQFDDTGSYTDYSWTDSTLQTNSIEIMDKRGGTTADGLYPTLAMHDYGAGGAQFTMEGATKTLHLAGGAGSSAGTLSTDTTYFDKFKIYGELEMTDAISFDSSVNGVINSPASLAINVDSDSNATAERVDIGYNKTGASSSNVIASFVETGNVGIGTTGPQVALSLVRAYNSSSTASNAIPGVNIVNDQGSYTMNNVVGALGFTKAQGYTSGIRAGVVATYNATGTNGANVGMNLKFKTAAEGAGDSVDRMIITGTGLVGIGKEPSEKLDVDGYVKATKFKGVLHSNDTRSTVTTPETLDTPGLTLDFKANSTNGLNDGSSYNGVMTFRPYGGLNDFSGGPSHQMGFTAGGRVFHRYGSATSWNGWRKMIEEDSSGNVGIGKNSPNAKLDVNGTIRAEQICDELGANCQDISTGWGGGGSSNPMEGKGRTNVARYGTSGAEAGLCTNGGSTFGLSNISVTWGAAPNACPTGTWVCSAAERGVASCDTARPTGGAIDAIDCSGSASGYGAGWLPGWVEDSNDNITGKTVSEAQGAGSMNTCYSLPVWCCS